MKGVGRFIRSLVLVLLPMYFDDARAQENQLLTFTVSTQPGGNNQFYAVDLSRGRSMAVSGPIPLSTVGSMEILPGNRHLVVLTQPPMSVAGFFLFNRDTEEFSPMPVPPLMPPWGATSILVDQEGELLSAMHYGGLYRLDRTGQWVRLPPNFLGETVVDIDTGDIIGVDTTATFTRYRPWSGELIGISARISHQPGWRIAQDPDTGDFVLWDGSVARNEMGNLLRVSAGGVVTSTAVLPWIMRGVEMFPDSAGREYVFTAGCPPGFCNVVPAIYSLSRSGSQITTLYTLPLDPRGMFQWNVLDMLRDRSRNLSTASAGIQNTWNLLLDFPGDPGLPYVVLLGISGIRPGIALPDGRKLRVNPDAVTYLAYTGQLPGFSGLGGTLDQNGKSQATMSLSWLPPAVRGRTFWAVGVTLGGGAPSGIRTVSDPIVVQIR